MRAHLLRDHLSQKQSAMSARTLCGCGSILRNPLLRSPPPPAEKKAIILKKNPAFPRTPLGTYCAISYGVTEHLCFL